ncbi:MAG: hypothetical protein IQL11_00790 [Bacteroidales bacterium]|nr:hypothetical protein [Bacteroidales bacterium]
MDVTFHIPEPILFNPLKHYLPFIREFINSNIAEEDQLPVKDLVKKLKHIGTCVMDIYTGDMPSEKIFREVLEFLGLNSISAKEPYKKWAGDSFRSYRIITLSDSSQWTLKYYNNEARYVHIFPARSSRHTFRVKANTLKSAILYYILIGKDYITGEDLNRARAYMGLSPVKDPADTEAITEMIEMLRR